MLRQPPEGGDDLSNSGSLFGWLVTAGFVLTLLNYPVKAVYRSVVARWPQTSKAKRIYMRFQKAIVLNHRFFALFTTVMLLAHVVIQLLYRWASLTGLIAATLMVANSLLGAYGHYIKKKRRSAWLMFHRLMAVLLVVAVVAHVASGGR